MGGELIGISLTRFSKAVGLGFIHTACEAKGGEAAVGATAA